MDITQILLLAACACFGVAVTLFVIALQSLRDAAEASAASMELTSVRRADRRRSAMAKSTLFRISLPFIQALAQFLRRFNTLKLQQYVAEPYQRAGYPGGLEDVEVVATGGLVGILLALFTGFTLFVFAGPLWAWMGIFVIPAGLLMVVSNLQTRAEIRQGHIIRSLPYVLDLLVLILRSGASMNIALRRVVADYAEHPIGEELGQVMAEMDVGSPRAEAFRNFARRVNIDDITALADSIVQAEELGWPLAESLERLADRLNSERMLRAQAKAGAAGVYVMLPSTLVLMAAVLLLFGPWIVKAFRGGFNLT